MNTTQTKVHNVAKQHRNDNIPPRLRRRPPRSRGLNRDRRPFIDSLLNRLSPRRDRRLRHLQRQHHSRALGSSNTTTLRIQRHIRHGSCHPRRDLDLLHPLRHVHDRARHLHSHQHRWQQRRDPDADFYVPCFGRFGSGMELYACYHHCGPGEVVECEPECKCKRYCELGCCVDF